MVIMGGKNGADRFHCCSIYPKRRAMVRYYIRQRIE